MFPSSLVSDAGSPAAELSLPATGLASLRGFVGAPFDRAKNLHILSGGEGSAAGEATIVVYAIGNAVRVHDLGTGEMRYVVGRDGGGVASVAVHSSRRLIAVAERRWTGGGGPRIYLYEYPSLKLVRVLEGGTDRSFTDIRFVPATAVVAAAAPAPVVVASPAPPVVQPTTAPAINSEIDVTAIPAAAATTTTTAATAEGTSD